MAFPLISLLGLIKEKQLKIESREKKIRDFEFNLNMRGDLPNFVTKDEKSINEFKEYERKRFYSNLKQV